MRLSSIRPGFDPRHRNQYFLLLVDIVCVWCLFCCCQSQASRFHGEVPIYYSNFRSNIYIDGAEAGAGAGAGTKGESITSGTHLCKA
jgi:hypothetical protein